MTRQEALKRLQKQFGNKLAYRVDPAAPSADEREAARTQCKGLAEAKRRAQEAMVARERAVLAADTDYQALLAAYKAAKQSLDQAFSATHHYKFTVGTKDDMFFHVKAQGDSWEDIFAKLGSEGGR